MNTERRVGFFLTVIGILSVITLLVRIIQSDHLLTRFFQDPSFYLVFLVSLIIFVLSIQTAPIFSKINGILQFFIFIIFAIVATIENYQSWYGMGLFTLAIVLGINYGYFKKYQLLKMSLMFILIAGTAEFSTRRSNNFEVSGFGMEVLIFMGFFFGIMFLCYYDDLNMTVGRVERLKIQKKNLILRMKNDNARISQLQEQIDRLESVVQPFDLSKCRLTKAEMKVLEILVTYRAGNAEIAERLHKSEDTVKIQMKSIFDKIGADDRYHVIEMCRYNFK